MGSHMKLFCNIWLDHHLRQPHFQWISVMSVGARQLIYFCGSMRAGRQDVQLYGRLVEKLSKYGEVLTPFVADKKITELGSEHKGGDKGIHDRDVTLLRQCSVVVA